MNEPRLRSFWSTIGPGILLFAAGVGAGDLLTASMAGSDIGLVVVWAALIGATVKWVLSEGIARWQMATGRSMLEGWLDHAPWFAWIFFAYFLLWTFGVGGALVNACGIAGTAFLQFGDPATSKIIWGIVHSLLGLLLVWRGSYDRFESIMKYVIGVKFAIVLLTAGLIVAADPGGILGGIFSPRMPSGVGGWSRFLGVLGGVGGTVTMLSYGYWIREAKRSGDEGLTASRKDLTVSYAGAALFGAAMVIIGSRIIGTGEGAKVAVQLADQLGNVLGPLWRWVFLIGFWATVFSSLVAVWQGVPYLFADFLRARRGHILDNEEGADLRRSGGYRWYLVGIATVPLVLLLKPVKEVQILYTTLGAWFMPALAGALLVMNNRKEWVESFRNRWLVNTMLVLTIALFLYLAAAGITE
jgi:Mn2+/Fe2+ NRAMP family transporter